MFNSIGRSSNFSQAGKSAADDMVRSFAAARRNSPNMGKLAQTAATIRSKEKQDAMKAAAAVTKTGIQAALCLNLSQKFLLLALLFCLRYLQDLTILWSKETQIA